MKKVVLVLIYKTTPLFYTNKAHRIIRVFMLDKECDGSKEQK